MAAPPSTPRLAILLSGGGRTLLNLHDLITRGELNATIPLVISSREGPGAERARARNLHTLVLPGQMTLETFSNLLNQHAIDLVILAGYLKKLPVPPKYRNKILNIHPALLPKYGGHGMYGDKVHAAVIAAGEKESGCTVHFVDDQYDTGPIILQRTCPVLATDDAHTLAARVFEQECIAYPQAIKMVLAN